MLWCFRQASACNSSMLYLCQFKSWLPHNLPPNNIGEVVEDGQSVWAPATHMEALEETPNYCYWSTEAPDNGSYLENEPSKEKMAL